MRVLVIFISALLLSGCVGLAVGSYGTFENKREKFQLSDKRNKFKVYSEPTSYNKEQVLSLWGRPDEVKQTGACETLIYHDGYTWSGIGAYVIILPVPLVVPSGYDETRIYLKDGRTVAAVTEYGELTSMFGYTCGSNKCGFNLGKVNQDKTRKVDVTWCDEKPESD